MNARHDATLTMLLAFAVGAGGTHAAAGRLRIGAARLDVTGPLGPSQAGKYDNEKIYTP